MRRTLAITAAVLAATATAQTPPGFAAPDPRAALARCVRPALPLTSSERVSCLNAAIGLRSAPLAPERPALPCEVAVPGYDDRCEVWSHVYANPGANGTGGIGDHMRDIAADPLGRMVYATGLSQDASTGPDYATVSVDAASGASRWVARWDGDGSDDRPWQLAVDPAGARVFVTGTRDFADGSGDQQTVAYDASSGEQLWTARVERPADDWGTGVVVSPDGERVYVVAVSEGGANGTDVGIAAYDAASGETVWYERFGTPAADGASDITISDDGRTLFVLADTSEPGGGFSTDYLAMAIDTGRAEEDEEETPSVRWTGRWGGGWLDWPFAIEEAAGRVIATGLVGGERHETGIVTNLDFGTVAFDAATGQQLWSHRYHSDHGGPNGGFALAVTPDGGTVLTTGQITGVATFMDLDFGTVAIDAATGTQKWAARHQLPGAMFEFGYAVDVSPNGSRTYVTGWASADAFAASAVAHGDIATLAYDTANGTQLWAARYSNDPPYTAYGQRMAVGPTGRVFVGGTRLHAVSATGNFADMAVLGYDG